MYDTNMSQGDLQAIASASNSLGPALMQMLGAAEIQPGTPPSYEICKVIYSYHPLGAILTDAPIRRAQAKPREIAVPGLADERLAKRFSDTWDSLGKVGGTVILHNLNSAARMYGIASLAVGEVGKDPSTPLDVNNIWKADLYFNILDPLNTAGSLVLDQNPNSPSFLKPPADVFVSGQRWHPSRLFVKMHEQPLYIEWTSSAFGFVGRSVYQRCLFSLKSYVQTMVTNQMVVKKSGLVVYKAANPGSFIDNVMQTFFGAKRRAIKDGVTGQVVSIGENEALETLNMQNLDKAFNAARTNIIKDIASATGMPASIIAQEALVDGLADGTEDANKEIEFLDYIRTDMNPGYAFLDAICRRKAWTPDFYETLRGDYKEFGEGGYERALHDWILAFSAQWPNLKSEPDSKKVEVEDVKMKAVIALAEVLLADADPETKAKIVGWVADNVNSTEHLFSGHLDIDTEELAEFYEENRVQEQERAEEVENEKPRQPRTLSA